MTAVAVCHYCRPQQTPLGLGDVSSANPVVSPVEYSAASNSPQISREDETKFIGEALFGVSSQSQLQVHT